MDSRLAVSIVRTASRVRKARSHGGFSAVLGAIIILLWIGVAVGAPLFTAYSPTESDPTALVDPTPSLQHPLGVDIQGRDIWARIVYGARTVLVLAPISLALAYFFGIIIGLTSGYYRGFLDIVFARLSDILLSFPAIALYILLIVTVGPSVLNVVLAVVISTTPAVGRIVRALTLELKEREFCAAARMRGESSFHIMLVEILPNCVPILLSDACLRMSYTIIKIGVLGFLGLGLPPPSPDWGGMVKDATAVMLIWPHMSLFPCIAIASLAVAFNLLADGIGRYVRGV